MEEKMSIPRRRRRSPDYISPCHSSNRKRLPPLERHHPLRFSPSRNGSEAAITETSQKLPSLETLYALTAKANGVAQRCDSSLGSCGGGYSFNSSFFNKCPTTPSPICSPISSLFASPRSELVADRSRSPVAEDAGFAIQNQGSCIISKGGNNFALGGVGGEEEEVKTQGRVLSDASLQSRLTLSASAIKKTRETESFAKQSSTTQSNPSVPRSLGSAYRYSQFDSNNGDDEEDEKWGLPTVSEEEHGGCETGRSLSQSFHFSAGYSEEDGYYSATGSGGSGCVVNDEMDEQRGCSMGVAQGRVRPLRTFETETGLDAETKLRAWKEEQRRKLLGRLRKGEAAIAEWEAQQKAKANAEMMEIEEVIWKKREKAMARFQRRIATAEKAAEEKKVKRRAATAKKMAKMEHEIDMTASKRELRWKIACF